jgi:hypothetical protein
MVSFEFKLGHDEVLPLFHMLWPFHFVRKELCEIHSNGKKGARFLGKILGGKRSEVKHNVLSYVTFHL